MWYVYGPNNTVVPVDGEAMSLVSNLMGNESYVRVGGYEQGDVFVSTVFLMKDHSYDGRTPILWETMVFGGDCDGYCERYASYESAVKGHERIVEMVKATEEEEN